MAPCKSPTILQRAVWLCGALLAFAVAFAVAGVKLTPVKNEKHVGDTDSVIDEGKTILVGCAPKGEKDLTAGEKCLWDNAAAKPKLPYDLIASVINWVLYPLSEGEKKERYKAWKKTEVAEQTVRDVLGSYVPRYKTVNLVNEGDMGPGAIQTQFEKALKKTSFKKEFDNRYIERTDKDALGDKTAVNGVVYKVKMTNSQSDQYQKDLVIKIVFPKLGRNGKVLDFPEESTMHRKLSEIFPATTETHFIPDYVCRGAVELPVDGKDRKFEWMVMERFGATATAWFKHNDAKMLPTQQQIELFLTRSFVVLRELHKAKYVHGDNHMSNWALSQKSKKTLFLYDFDQTMEIQANFGYVVEDLQRWVEMIDDAISDLMKMSRLKEYHKPLMTKRDQLKEALKPTMWFNPDNYLKFAHYHEYALPSYDALMATKPLIAFMKIVNEWLKPDEHPLTNQQEEITSWLPK